ncbi:MAG: hypothetical protein SH818_04160 [Saprospiraceae bacterium]|nr:hypothetical protein [Saprospiraceae bacterium]
MSVLNINLLLHDLLDAVPTVSLAKDLRIFFYQNEVDTARNQW